MDCTKCGATIQTSAMVCQFCGTQVCSPPPVTTQPQFVQPNSVDAGQPVKSIFGFNALKPYYQIEFQKMEDSQLAYKGKWNWAAFFWSWIWALTKGLWLSAVIWIAACVFTAGFAGLVMPFVYGFRGNMQYYMTFKTGKQSIF